MSKNSPLIRQSTPEALALKVVARDCGQFSVETTGPMEDFDREYFSVSGYFGVHGPHIFAAAPELLAACREMLPKGVRLTNANVPDSTIIPLDVTMGELRKIAAAIAKATGAS